MLSQLVRLEDGRDGAVERELHRRPPALGSSPAADRINGMLMVLDRVEAEWPIAAGHLAEDNRPVSRLYSAASDGRGLG